MKIGPWLLTDLKSVPSNGKTVFSCFHCGGGSTMGYKLSGFDVLGGVEIDKKMMNLYRTNHNPKYSYLMGVQEFKNIPNDKLPKELFELDILDGSPPCSSFSISGNREKNWGDKKKFREGQAYQVLDDLFFDFIDIAKKLQPKIVVAENVKGLIQGNARGYVKQIFQNLNDVGYETQLFLLNSAAMGVPQKRERTFFIARRKDLKLPKIVLLFKENQITLKETLVNCAISKHKSITKVALDLWKKCAPGSKFDSVHEKKHRFNWSREHWNRPCRTMTSASSDMILHPSEPRPFTDPEKCRIQSFPEDYNFCDQNAGYVCGMSVPPNMMNRLSDQIFKQLLF